MKTDTKYRYQTYFPFEGILLSFKSLIAPEIRLRFYISFVTARKRATCTNHVSAHSLETLSAKTRSPPSVSTLAVFHLLYAEPPRLRTLAPQPKVAPRREDCGRDSAVFTAAAAAVAAATATTPPTAAVRVATTGDAAAEVCAVGGGGPRRLHRQRLGGRFGRSAARAAARHARCRRCRAGSERLYQWPSPTATSAAVRGPIGTTSHSCGHARR